MVKNYFKFEIVGNDYIKVLEVWPGNWWGGSYVGTIYFENDGKLYFGGNGYYPDVKVELNNSKDKDLKDVYKTISNIKSDFYKDFYKKLKS